MDYGSKRRTEVETNVRPVMGAMLLTDIGGNPLIRDAAGLCSWSNHFS